MKTGLGVQPVFKTFVEKIEAGKKKKKKLKKKPGDSHFLAKLFRIQEQSLKGRGGGLEGGHQGKWGKKKKNLGSREKNNS